MRLEALEPRKKPRDVGLGRDHALADGCAGKPVGMRAAKNAQDVVLRCGEAPAADLPLEGALQAIAAAQQVQECLFLGAGESGLLQDFELQVGHWRGLRKAGSQEPVARSFEAKAAVRSATRCPPRSRLSLKIA